MALLKKLVEQGNLGEDVNTRGVSLLKQIRDKRIMRLNDVATAAVVFIACRQVCMCGWVGGWVWVCAAHDLERA